MTYLVISGYDVGTIMWCKAIFNPGPMMPRCKCKTLDHVIQTLLLYLNPKMLK